MSREDARVSLGKGTRRDLMNDLGVDGDENEKDGRHEVEGESVGKNSWNRGIFKGRCGNQLWLKLPGIYESDPKEFFVMKDTESQQATSSS